MEVKIIWGAILEVDTLYPAQREKKDLESGHGPFIGFMLSRGFLI